MLKAFSDLHIAIWSAKEVNFWIFRPRDWHRSCVLKAVLCCCRSKYSYNPFHNHNYIRLILNLLFSCNLCWRVGPELPYSCVRKLLTLSLDTFKISW